MNIYRKLNDIMKAENKTIQVKKKLNWLEIIHILKKKPYRKYVFWLIHNKIYPEIGQVSPTLTHCGQNRIM